MNRLDPVTIYANPDPLLISRQAVFPGLAVLADGDILAMFSIGQAFDAADQRAHVCRSGDGGKSWTPPVLLHRGGGPVMESESYKPLVLADGSLIATGYVFERPDALTPIIDPKTSALLPMRNKISRSGDGGRTWSAPTPVDIDGRALELSGPPIQLTSGRILAAGSPFHLGAEGQEGWIIASDDQGRHWRKLSAFFSGGTIAAWECRLAEIAPGRVAVLFWAYDTETGHNLCNHIAYSDDGGAHFHTVRDTTIRGQAANILPQEGTQVLTIHAHREDPVSLTVRRVDTAGDGFEVIEHLDLFSGSAQASDTTDIRAQFGSLKFGQPSLTRLSDGTVLAAWWRLVEGQHVIEGYRLAP